jgi:hypothetical protein
MTDITERLRSIYVSEGANYVQEAADLIECLRAERKSMVNDVHSCGPTCVKAGCVNRRLRDALSMWLDLHDSAAGYEGKCGKALDAAIDAQQTKIDAAVKAAFAALGETK